MLIGFATARPSHWLLWKRFCGGVLVGVQSSKGFVGWSLVFSCFFLLWQTWKSWPCWLENTQKKRVQSLDMSGANSKRNLLWFFQHQIPDAHKKGWKQSPTRLVLKIKRQYVEGRSSVFLRRSARMWYIPRKIFWFALGSWSSKSFGIYRVSFKLSHDIPWQDQKRSLDQFCYPETSDRLENRDRQGSVDPENP